MMTLYQLPPVACVPCEQMLAGKYHSIMNAIVLPSQASSSQLHQSYSLRLLRTVL